MGKLELGGAVWAALGWIALGAPAQHHPNQGAHGKDPVAAPARRAEAPHGAKDTPLLHRPITRLPPEVVFAHLKAGHAAWQTAFPDKKLPQPRIRPAGSGTFVATVLHPPELRFRPEELFATGRRDLFCMSAAGPITRPAEVGIIELLEKADVPLCVILVQRDSLALRLRTDEEIAGSPGLKYLQQHARAAAHRAKRDGVSRELAHARLQREALLAGSPTLRRRARTHKFRVALGIVDQRTGFIEWEARDLNGWPVLLDAKPPK